ncbi:hypothetical protein Q1695_005412 [Nippostrongylus brasiliensis]|nr:hypothetical protein Q1695_005412 [Nippostrongylus brasiliensis]
MPKENYREIAYENPPPVTEASGDQIRHLSAGQFDQKLGASKPPSAPTVSIGDAIFHSHDKTDDGTIKVTARSVFRIVNYACFLTLVTYVILAQSSVQSFYFTKTISDLFVASKNAPARKAFTEISTIDDIWDFLSGELLTAFYQTNAPLSSDEFAMVYYNNKLLGRPRIRMLKVKNNSCAVVQSFAREINQCYSNYKTSVEDRNAFGSGDTEAYIWQSADVLMTEPTQGTIATYGGGGFVVRLPLDDVDEANKIIRGIKKHRWIDRGTRAIIIDFALFNANVNLFSIARLLLELPASGGVISSYRFSTYDLMRYIGVHGQVLIVLEGILVGLVIYYIVEELIELYRVRLLYFLSFWNFVDIALLTLCCIDIHLNWKRTQVAADRINTVLENGLTDAAFDDVMTTQELFNNIAAVILFLAWIKVFKYIGVNKTMNQLSATLSRSTKDIGGFAVMFAVFFFAYAQFGYLVFGTQIVDYSTFIGSGYALLRTILGDFNFHDLERTNRVLGPLFFISYVFLVFFVLLNMFLAIINDSYVEVKAELARNEDGEGIFDWIQKKLRRKNSNEKKLAVINDYKNELMNAGYPEKDIDDAFEKVLITTGQEINDKALRDIGNEVKQHTERKKLVDGEQATSALARRVDLMDRAMFNLYDRMSGVLYQLSVLEHARVEARENRAFLIGELKEVADVDIDRQQIERLVD